ncbi:MAG TPA: hypothetical protein PLW78_07805 [bacterium]|nr:hypothetical protein [bacterium]HRQ70190.1 hypothetical protein [bacterium]
MMICVRHLMTVVLFLMFSGCMEDVVNEHAELNSKIAKIKCEKEFECCIDSTMPRHYKTVEECVRYNEILSAQKVAHLPFSNFKWNKENADKCLEYWNTYSLYSLTCDEDLFIDPEELSESEQERVLELKSSCDSLIEGSSELGEKCYPDIKEGNGCAEGLTCYEGTYACEKIPLINESCVVIDQCYTDEGKEIYCDKIYKKNKEGDIETDENGKYIVESATCKYAPVVGEDCSSYKKCDSNLEDVFCEIIYKKDSEGEYEYDEDSGDKIIDSATCKKLPEKGKSCELSKHCYKEDEGELYCAKEKDEEGNSEYFCRELPKANMPCSEYGECAKGLICKYEEDEEGDFSEICRAKSKEGAKCSNTYECEDDLFCMIGEEVDEGKCTKKLPGGSACLEDDHCLSGECLFNDETIGSCMGTKVSDQMCIQYDYGDDYIF